jgi:hypothetical protein
MVVMVLVFGMTVVGCDNGSTGNDGRLDGDWWGSRNSSVYVIHIWKDNIYVEGKTFSGFDGTISYNTSSFSVKTEEGRTFSGFYILDADTLEIRTTDTRYQYLNGVYYNED